MVEGSILIAVQKYVAAVRVAGLHVSRVVLFGSRARGEAGPDSDIDLVVVAPELDDLRDRQLVFLLWELRAVTDSRIEPVPCGEREWENPSRPIIEIARREGIVIAA